MTDWIILRTASSQTLNLAHSLAEAGFQVWTPSITEERRIGPLRSRRQISAPLMPSWVFARSERLFELVELSHSPSLIYRVWDAEQRRMIAKGHPKFTVFRDVSGYGYTSETQLAPLRRAERRGKPKDKIREFKIGEEVRVTDGAFEGMIGIVESVRSPYVSVAFPRSSHVPKLPFWMLAPVAMIEKAA